MRKISTKNLYLCEIRTIKDRTLVMGTAHVEYNLSGSFILAKKTKHGYIDVFTSTKYEQANGFQEIGTCCVEKTFSVPGIYKYISRESAIELLNELNHPNSKQEESKILFKRRERGNYYGK